MDQKKKDRNCDSTDFCLNKMSSLCTINENETYVRKMVLFKSGGLAKGDEKGKVFWALD